MSASPSAPIRASSFRSCATPTSCRSPRSRRTIGRLGKPARDGKLSIDDMQGGTFTITNGGIYGSLMSTPILNAPQSGILGMHKIQDRPMVVGGQIVIRPMMYLALSYDHRIVDGKEAVTFLVSCASRRTWRTRRVSCSISDRPARSTRPSNAPRPPVPRSSCSPTTCSGVRATPRSRIRPGTSGRSMRL
jgi:hypothetical protein